MRFNVKTLMYVTAVTAAYALLLREAIHDNPGWGAIVGYVAFVSLLGWKLYQQHKADMAMMSEAAKQEKPGE